jgi:hypothetical protein
MALKLTFTSSFNRFFTFCVDFPVFPTLSSMFVRAFTFYLAGSKMAPPYYHQGPRGPPPSSGGGNPFGQGQQQHQQQRPPYKSHPPPPSQYHSSDHRGPPPGIGDRGGGSASSDRGNPPGIGGGVGGREFMCKRVMCREILSKGRCPFGMSCKFSHSEEEKQVCRFIACCCLIAFH